MRYFKKIDSKVTLPNGKSIILLRQGGEGMTLKDLRIESGLKAKKVAAELGISRVQLYNLENGKYRLDKLKISVLAYLYRVTEEDIIKSSLKNESK